MVTDFIPNCCSICDTPWTLPNAPADSYLRAFNFAPDQWTLEQSQRCQLPIMAGANKRQAEFLAGRLSAREAVHALTGQRVIVVKDAEGAPCWPAGVTGSITHSAGLAMALVAATESVQSIGMDIEHILSAERAAKLARHIHTPDEWQQLQGLPEAERALRTSCTFSLKESLFKALFPLVKKRFYFQDAALIDYQPHGEARLKLLIDLSADWPRGRIFTGQFTVREDRLLSAVIIPKSSTADEEVAG